MRGPLTRHEIDPAKLAKITSCTIDTDKGAIKLALFPDAAPNTT